MADARAEAPATPALSRARLGVTLLFVTNGLIWSNLAPRYPEIRRGLGLSYAQFGTAVMFGAVGAMVVGLTAAAVIRRYRSSRVAVVSMILMAVFALLASLAMTGVYHAGYSDFRSTKVAKPVAGDVVWSIPTLVTLNPIGAPIAHAGLHVSAVLHSYETETFLPPHE